MTDIGTSLRDTRIRKKIDIGTVESATKIRAKYLRALENEEWAVLPGPTYVKSFLRTYGEYLGLDPYLLIEEYNARYEEPEELELPAFTQERPMRRQVRRVPTIPRWAVALAIFGVFIAILFVIGLTSNDKDEPASQPTNRRALPSTTPKPDGSKPSKRAQERASNGLVRLSIVPKREVWVCVVDAKGEERVNGRVLSAGERQGPYESRRFRLTVGNGAGDFIVNGRRRNVPETSEPLGYSVTAGKVRTLSDTGRPTCGQ